MNLRFSKSAKITKILNKERVSGKHTCDTLRNNYAHIVKKICGSKKMSTKNVKNIFIKNAEKTEN